MKRLAYAAACAGMLLVLAGCGQRPVEETILPTRVPLLDPNTFAVTVAPPAPEPTATPVPAPTTAPAPTAVAPAPAPTAAPPLEPPPTTVPTVAPTPEVAASATVTATDATTGVIAPSPAVTTTTAITAAGAVTTTSEVTATGAVTAAVVVDTGAAVLELPAGVAAALAQADPLRGQQLTLSSGCIGCHSLDPNQVMPGPTWRNVGNVAATRVADGTAEVYLYNSIIHPNAYVVEGFLPNIMLQIYQNTLSEQNQADLIAYLLTLKSN